MINTITKTVNTDVGEFDLIINEYNTKKEIIKLIQEWKDSIKLCEKLHQDAEMFIFVLYEDGSYYARSYGYIDGKFKYDHIKAVNMDDGYEYYTYGEYSIDENGILTV